MNKEELPKAAQELLERVEAGDTEAMYFLITDYWQYITEDDAKLWLGKAKAAAEAGDLAAQYDLASMYYHYVKDYGLAWDWYYKSAKGGYAPAQADVGWAYYKGEFGERGFNLGISPDFYTAESYLTKAANQGDTYAQFCLGEMYDDKFRYNLFSDRLPALMDDYVRAVEWYRKAAKQGGYHANVAKGKLRYLREYKLKEYGADSEDDGTEFEDNEAND